MSPNFFLYLRIWEIDELLTQFHPEWQKLGVKAILSAVG